SAALALGLFIGFLPWILGWLILDLPYLHATIHQMSNPNDAADVHRRGLVTMLQGAWTGLPHNLWPWTFSEATAAAYMADPSDLLDYQPGQWDWAIRGLIIGTGILGCLGGLLRKKPLTVAFLLLPSVHYLFVMRLSNPGGWPDIPHRYLVLVFPAVVAASALGVGWILEGAGRIRKGFGGLLLLALALVAVHGIYEHSRWLKLPDFEALSQWDALGYNDSGLGQVRLSEGAAVTELSKRYTGPMRQATLRGVGLVYQPNADYYLLWRRETARAAPYPNDVLRHPDLLSTQPGEDEAYVLGAYEGTVLRSGGNRELLEYRLCSWRPDTRYAGHVQTLLAQREPELDCARTRP
ncbi:MAG: hypothetical protein VX498_15975, partial [Myxococcota bacterium]|nr:hypothetical protein [Myxococcota bacterium]